MEAIDYVAPRSLEELYQQLNNGKTSQFLAGGTDVIVQLREGRRHCEQVVDLKHVPELMASGFGDDGTLHIGAAVPVAELYEDPEVRQRLPGIVDAASLIGGIQIQSRASLGGNVCNASPAADSIPALIVHGAMLVIGSSKGTRELPIEQFFRGPGQNALEQGEILVQIKVPPQPPRSGARFLRFIPRNEMDIAVTNAAARIQLDQPGERIESARIAVGAVAPTPLLVQEAADAIVGQAPTEEAFEAAGRAAAAASNPITDMRGSAAQRRHLARVLTIRALEGALQRAREAREA